jgi:hypothetical protein
MGTRERGQQQGQMRKTTKSREKRHKREQQKPTDTIEEGRK